MFYIYHTPDIGRKCIADFFARNSIVAEIGVWKGYLSEAFVAAVPQKLYLIDCWENQGQSSSYTTDQLYNEDHDANYRLVLEKFSNLDNVEIIKAYSDEAVNKFPDQYFDFIYIDANHTVEGVFEDLKRWIPKIKDGGWCGGHDYYLPQIRPPRSLQYIKVREGLEKFFTYKGWNLNRINVIPSYPSLDGSFLFQVGEE